MNYAQEIQCLFYNKNPELNKLEFGCEVINSDGSICYTGNDKTFDKLLKEDWEKYGFVILGKPITTLQAISLLNDTGGASLSAAGVLWVLKTDEYISIKTHLPLLRDQSEEVQKQLWELIVKK